MCQSHPQQLISDYKPGEPLNMEVKVDVYPDATFKGDYKGLKVRHTQRWRHRGIRRGQGESGRRKALHFDVLCCHI